MSDKIYHMVEVKVGDKVKVIHGADGSYYHAFAKGTIVTVTNVRPNNDIDAIGVHEETNGVMVSQILQPRHFRKPPVPKKKETTDDKNSGLYGI
jgi:hypothetical protein